ncbi:MAG: hypothetical protein RBQ95_02565 [Paracholeplasma sp.]|nr:hypothetical protein [Paracholeplasma sp.]MDY3195720.1 hypothetical protein [Paracholeplasma sp.]
MKLKWAYGLLVSYSLMHLIFFFSTSSVLVDILKMEADPLVFTVFNLMGLFPLSFLLYALFYETIEKKEYPYFILSFMLGAFALTPYFIKRKEVPSVTKNRPRAFLLVIGVMSLLLIIYGVILGRVSEYSRAFMSDSFVHIMTFDFLFMIGLSVYLMYPIKKHWYLAFIPVVGFYYLLSTKD